MRSAVIHQSLKTARLSLVLLVFCLSVKAQVKTDAVAENMLLYQREVGGWPKAVGNIKVDYHKTLTEPDRMATMEDASRNDATIDNDATYKEINYLVSAYKSTGNKAYVQSAEKGIRYLLKAQESNGGWPQFYPDTSFYRKYITFNDNAMINAMTILNNVAKRQQGFEVVNPALVTPSAKAVERGIQCILKTQVRVNGKLTAWCQQYDNHTLQPAMARKFELVGLSSEESASIVDFLLQVEHPSSEIKNAVTYAVEWFKQVELKGYRFDHITDTTQPTGRDAVLVTAPANAVLWARYYEIGTNRPFFAGRNSIKVYDLKQLENERRAGYAWYGTWPEQLLKTDYPAWAKKNSI